MSKSLASANFPIGDTGTGSYVVTVESSKELQFGGANITNHVFQLQGNRARVQVMVNGEVRLAPGYAVNHLDEIDEDLYIEELKKMSQDQLSALIKKVPELQKYLTNMADVSKDLNQHAPKIIHALMVVDNPMPTYNFAGAWNAAIPIGLLQKMGNEPLTIDHGDKHFNVKFEMMQDQLSNFIGTADDHQFNQTKLNAKIVNYINDAVKLQFRKLE